MARAPENRGIGMIIPHFYSLGFSLRAMKKSGCAGGFFNSSSTSARNSALKFACAFSHQAAK
jgi:hypothetical protein